MKPIRFKSLDHLEFFGEVVSVSSCDIYEQKDGPKADFPLLTSINSVFYTYG